MANLGPELPHFGPNLDPTFSTGSRCSLRRCAQSQTPPAAVIDLNMKLEPTFDSLPYEAEYDMADAKAQNDHAEKTVPAFKPMMDKLRARQGKK